MNSLFIAAALRDEFDERLETADLLFKRVHPGVDTKSDAARDVRGLVIILLFGAYERLLTQTTRQLIESASSFNVGARRLQPPFRAIAVANLANSLRDSGKEQALSERLPDLVAPLDTSSRARTLDPNFFPEDGSFMKTSQIRIWCQVCSISKPEFLLQEICYQIDGGVADRNAIAHGRDTATKIGSRPSPSETEDLIRGWGTSWRRFLDQAEVQANSRSFYRKP